MIKKLLTALVVLMLSNSAFAALPYSVLEKVNSPKDIKKLSVTDMNILAD